MTDPVAGYKALLDTAHQAARRHQEHERRRAIELVGEMIAADKEITAATDKEKKVTAEINEWWRQVSGPLAGVNRFPAHPRLAPDPTADPNQLREYLAEVEPATRVFTSALRRAAWPRKL